MTCSLLALCLHDENHLGRLCIELAENPVYVPVKSTKHRDLQFIFPENLLNLDVIFSRVPKSPGLFDGSLRIFQKGEFVRLDQGSLSLSVFKDISRGIIQW